MSKELKAIQEKLSELQDRIFAEADKCEATFSSRSEKWQESEKGEALKAKEEKLNEVHEYLDNAGGLLLEILEEL